MLVQQLMQAAHAAVQLEVRENEARQVPRSSAGAGCAAPSAKLLTENCIWFHELSNQRRKKGMFNMAKLANSFNIGNII